MSLEHSHYVESDDLMLLVLLPGKYPEKAGTGDLATEAGETGAQLSWSALVMLLCPHNRSERRLTVLAWML